MELSFDLIAGYVLGLSNSVIGNLITPFVHKVWRKYVNKYLIILLVFNALFVSIMVSENRLFFFLFLSLLPILDGLIRNKLSRYFCKHGYPKGLGWISPFIERYTPVRGRHLRSEQHKMRRIFPV